MHVEQALFTSLRRTIVKFEYCKLDNNEHGCDVRREPGMWRTCRGDDVSFGSPRSLMSAGTMSPMRHTMTSPVPTPPQVRIKAINCLQAANLNFTHTHEELWTLESSMLGDRSDVTWNQPNCIDLLDLAISEDLCLGRQG